MWKKKLGLEGVGVGVGYIFNIVIAKGWGSTIFICNYLGEGGKVLIHHIFLNSPPPTPTPRM